MFSNKYPGDCVSCGQFVPAGAGFYDSGAVFCDAPSLIRPRDGAPTWAVRYSWGRFNSGAIRDVAPAIVARVTATAIMERFPQAFGVSDGVDACPVLAAWLLSDALRVDAADEMAARVAHVDALADGMREELAALVAESRVRSLSAVIVKVLGSDVAPADMTGAELSRVVAELQNRIARRNARKDPNCGKCGGTGAYWKLDALGVPFDDGCWRCAGTGRKLSYR